MTRATPRTLLFGGATGRIDPKRDPHRLAPQFIAMSDGLQVQWLPDPDAVDMAAVFEDFLDRVRPSMV